MSWFAQIEVIDTDGNQVLQVQKLQCLDLKDAKAVCKKLSEIVVESRWGNRTRRCEPVKRVFSQGKPVYLTIYDLRYAAQEVEETYKEAAE